MALCAFLDHISTKRYVPLWEEIVADSNLF